MVAVVLLAVLCACVARGGTTSAFSSTPSPLLTSQGAAPGPTPLSPSIQGQPEAAFYKKLASRVIHCEYAQAERTIDRKVYVGCSGGDIAVFDDHNRLIVSGSVPMYQINDILPAGADAIAVSGVNVGAALRNELSILRART